MTALVSIVLPTYNRSVRLARSLESCLCQTHVNIEIIVVDDGSTDDTAAVVEEFARRDPRVHYVRQNNLKLPAALNTGHRQATGDFLTWTSDDNRYAPDAIAIMVEFLTSHPEFGMVYCDMEKIGPDDSSLGAYELLDPDQIPHHSCVGACFLYTRAVYDTIGGYSLDTFLAEDYDYWLRIYLKFPIKRLRDVRPYQYACHPDSLSSRRQGEVIVQTAKVRCRHVVPADQHRKTMCSAYWSALWYHRKRRDAEAGWPCAVACVRLAPFNLLYWKAFVGTALLRLNPAFGGPPR